MAMPRRLTSTPRRGPGSSAPTDPPSPLSCSPRSPSSIPSSPSSFSSLQQCPGSDCKHEERDPDKMLAHLYQCHSKRLVVSAEIERAYGIPVKRICPGCRVLYPGVRRHLSAIKKPCPARDTALILWRAISASSSSSLLPRSARFRRWQQQPPRARFDTHRVAPGGEPAADHPLPLTRPRVWDRVPPELRDRFINLIRPGLIAYVRTTDLAVKARIIIEFHRAINFLLSKVHGNGSGKALSSLRRVEGRVVTGIFAAFRSQFPSPSPVVPPPPVVVDIWVDGSAGKPKDAENNNKRGETGIGVVVHDTRVGPELKEIKAFLGTGTNNSAEISAIIYALELYADEPLIQLRINTDSQYARGQAGHDDVNPQRHHLVDHLRGLIRARTPRPLIEKVRAHADVKENELADKLAGQARIDRSPMPQPTSFLASKARALASFPPSLSEEKKAAAHSQPLSPPPRAPNPVPSAGPPSSLPAPLSSSALSLQPSKPLGRPEIADGSPNDDDDETTLSCLRRAAGKVELGYVGAAVDMLSRSPLPDLTDKARAHLESLHPKRDPAAAPIVVPPNFDVDAIPPPVDEGAVLKLIKRCDNGRAAGPSNLTAGHLRVLASDPDCLLGITAMVRDIVGGELDQAAVDLLGAAISVPIPKGDPAREQVRPLAVPEILYKISSMLLLESVDHHSRELFPSIQWACGKSNGSETAIHRSQIRLERGGAGSDTVSLSFDCRNAFNERERAAIAKALFAAPATSRLWRFFMCFYGNGASHLGVYQRGELIHHFLNSQGVKQGDPCATFLYALSVQALYEAAVNGDKTLEAVAFADDFTITGPSRNVLAAFDRLRALCSPGSGGPALNLSKCRALWPYSCDHPNYAPFCDAMAAHGIVVLHDSLPLLGGAIGLGMHRAVHAMKVATSHARLFKLLSHPHMKAQSGFLILHRSARRRLGYHLRVYPPIIIRKALEFFDEQIVNTTAKVCDIPSPGSNPHIMQSIQLSFKNDGMDMRPCTRESPVAYFSSVALSADDLAHGHDDLAADIAGTDFEFHLKDTYEVLRGGGIRSDVKGMKKFFPPSFDHFWSFFTSSSEQAGGVRRPRMQHHVGWQFEWHWALRHLPDAPAMAELPSPPDPPGSAFTAKSMLHSPSLLFTTLPTSRRTNINTHRFRLAIRHLLNLPVTDSMPDECKCGAIFADEPSHFHSCALNRKVGTYKRHNAIARTIKEICDEIGIPCQWNPRLEDEKGNRTMPDLLMSAHDGDVEIDVSVCSVWCKTNRAMDDPIGSREKAKRSKYEATRAANGHAFIPAVCDSIGRLGPGMRQIIGLLVSHHNNTATSHTLNPKLREHIIRGLTIQLHEGNALVDITGLQYYPAARPLTRLPHPNRPPPPPPPPIPHDTLCSKLASPEDIPSTIDASSSSSPRLSSSSLSPTYIDPNCPTERRKSSSDSDDHGDDEGSDDDDGLIEHEEKRTGPSSLSLSSTASSSATLLFARRSQPLPKTGDLPHKANLHSSSIVDSPTSLSLSSSLSLPRIPLFPRLHVPFMIPPTLPPPGAPSASSTLRRTPLHRPPDD